MEVVGALSSTHSVTVVWGEMHAREMLRHGREL